VVTGSRFSSLVIGHSSSRQRASSFRAKGAVTMKIELDFLAVLAQWPLLLKGVAWTLGLRALSAVLGGIVSVACARARAYGAKPLA